MLEGMDVPAVTDMARAAGGVGLFVWLLVVLLRRGDSLQRENIEELRQQRDDYRARLEEAQAELAAHRRHPHGPHDGYGAR